MVSWDLRPQFIYSNFLYIQCLFGWLGPSTPVYSLDSLFISCLLVFPVCLCFPSAYVSHLPMYPISLCILSAYVSCLLMYPISLCILSAYVSCLLVFSICLLSDYSSHLLIYLSFPSNLFFFLFSSLSYLLIIPIYLWFQSTYVSIFYFFQRGKNTSKKQK